MTHAVHIPDDVLQRVRLRRGRLTLFDTLDARSTALLVIDMQDAFLLPGAAGEVAAARGIVPAISRLAQGLRDKGGLVAWVKMTVRDDTSYWSVWFEHFMSATPRGRGLTADLVSGGPGHGLYGDLDVRDGDLVVEKTRYSAFIQGSSDLDGLLRARGIDTVVVVGTLTNVCSESTARDAMMLNYKTVLVSDANATLSDADHNASLAAVIQTFGEVITTDEVLAKLA